MGKRYNQEMSIKGVILKKYFGQKNIVSILLLLLSASSVFSQNFYGSFDLEKIKYTEEINVNFQDTIPSRAIYAGLSSEKQPLAFYREINTGVCMEGVCKPISLKIYWTVSGRYLGIGVENNNKLTKYEHEPFSFLDYIQLNDLLADPQSMLSKYEISELIPKVDSKHISKIDARSGATIPSLSGYIVPGAAYTTYALWNLVYGATRDSVRKISSNYISLDLMKSLLQEGNGEDKIWALQNLKYLKNQTELSIPLVQKLVLSGDSFWIEPGINSIVSTFLSNSTKQEKLMEIFSKGGFGLKLKILKTLLDYELLTQESAVVLIQQLPYESPNIINLIFRLFKQNYEPTQVEYEKISTLLKHENRNVSDACFNYLSTIKNKNPRLSEELKKYRLESQGF